jgi:cellulose synthase/poly-beta-1,6-N-acetylglucosamine synthase-like glycosyltransferase
LRRPLAGFHGEGLILKGKVLKEIGYDFYSLTEDFRFAQELCKSGYKTWHSSTKISILSPNSIRDLVRQRARWFKRIASDLRHVHWLYFLILPLHIALWPLSFFGSAPFFFVSLALGIPFFLLFPAGFLYWVIGAFILPKASIKEKIVAWLISPIETLAPLRAIRMKTFEVIDKTRTADLSESAAK